MSYWSHWTWTGEVQIRVSVHLVPWHALAAFLRISMNHLAEEYPVWGCYGSYNSRSNQQDKTIYYELYVLLVILFFSEDYWFGYSLRAKL